jgi:hypothetical protein
VQREEAGQRQVADLRAALEKVAQAVAKGRNCTDDPEADPGRPVGFLVPGEQVTGERQSQSTDQKQHADHPGELARPLVGAPDEDLHEVRQQQDDHGAGAPVVPARTNAPSGTSSWMYLTLGQAVFSAGA